MDFKDQIKNLGDRVEKLREQILTEEGTKNALVCLMKEFRLVED